MTSFLLNFFIIGLLVTVCSSVSPPKRAEHEEDPINTEELGYTVHSHKCGGKIDLKSRAILEAVEYPDDYQFRKECIWSIKVDYGSNVALITNSMNLDDTDNCNSNYLAVRDDKDEEGTLIGVYCGKRLPPKIQSVKNGLLVKFVSSSPGRNSSFSATVIKTDDECTNHMDTLENSYFLPDNWTSGKKFCGKTFGPTETEGTITNPCYPGIYPQNGNCVWKIVAPAGVKIILNFKVLDLKSDESSDHEMCRDASLEISSMQETTVLKNHGKFCGKNIPSSIISEGNALEIKFKSSSQYNHGNAGFVLEYSHNS